MKPTALLCLAFGIVTTACHDAGPSPRYSLTVRSARGDSVITGRQAAWYPGGVDPSPAFQIYLGPVLGTVTATAPDLSLVAYSTHVIALPISETMSVDSAGIVQPELFHAAYRGLLADSGHVTFHAFVDDFQYADVDLWFGGSSPIHVTGSLLACKEAQLAPLGSCLR